jgi:hypothetical protein
MPKPTSAMLKTVKMSILLNRSGQIIGASKPSDYRPAKDGDEPEVSVRSVAGPGQSIVEVEVPADLAGLDGGELLSRLAEQIAARTVIAGSPVAGEGPTAGQASLGSSPSLRADVITAGSSNVVTPGKL